MSKVKSVKIWSRGDMCASMYQFGFKAFEQFKQSIDSDEYGPNWKDCVYSNKHFYAWARLTKSGQASVMVYRDSD